MGCIQSDGAEQVEKANFQDQPPTPGENDPAFKQGNPLNNISQTQDINKARDDITKILNQIKKKYKQQRIITRKNLEEHHFIRSSVVVNQYQYKLRQSMLGNPITITNILNWAIQLNPQCQAQMRLQVKFVKNFQFLNAFIYLYTGDYFYGAIRRQFTTYDHMKIGILVKTLKDQINFIKRKKPDLFDQIDLNQYQKRLKANSQIGQFVQLYRGINRFDKSLYAKPDQLYAWRSFISTSMKYNVAQGFANLEKKKGKTIYTIKLKRDKPHDHIIIPKLQQWSQNKNQQEVLLFPLFKFVCVEQKKDENLYTYDLQQYDKLRHLQIKDSTYEQSNQGLNNKKS